MGQGGDEQIRQDEVWQASTKIVDNFEPVYKSQISSLPRRITVSDPSHAGLTALTSTNAPAYCIGALYSRTFHPL